MNVKLHWIPIGSSASHWILIKLWSTASAAARNCLNLDAVGCGRSPAAAFTSGCCAVFAVLREADWLAGFQADSLWLWQTAGVTRWTDLRWHTAFHRVTSIQFAHSGASMSVGVTFCACHVAERPRVHSGGGGNFFQTTCGPHSTPVCSLRLHSHLHCRVDIDAPTRRTVFDLLTLRLMHHWPAHQSSVQFFDSLNIFRKSLLKHSQFLPSVLSCKGCGWLKVTEFDPVDSHTCLASEGPAMWRSKNLRKNARRDVDVDE